MCGIFFCADPELDKDQCIKCLKMLENRGPDYTHYDIIDNDFFMGQTTLEINGKYDKQNYVSDNGEFTLLFNGEIYNYKDIIAEYGFPEDYNDTRTLVNYISRLYDKSPDNKSIVLDGMYCFVCLQRKNDDIHLYISRDMQGEKGLYYYETGNIMIYSSEIGPILEYLRIKDIQTSLNIGTIKNYFYTRHFSTYQSTCYQNINQMECGYITKYTIKGKKGIYIIPLTMLNGLFDKKYYDELHSKTNDELVDILDKLIRKNIKEMLPTTNIKYASVLSGGIDSSLSSYYLNELEKERNRKLDMVNINCKGIDNFEKYIPKFATKLNNDVKVLQVDAKKYASEVKRCYSFIESPILTHSMVSYSIMCDNLKQNGYKVLFTGEGADELFGGYECYLGRYEGDNTFSNYSGISRSIETDDNQFDGLDKGGRDKITYSNKTRHDQLFSSYTKEYLNLKYDNKWDEISDSFSQSYFENAIFEASHQAQLMVDCEAMLRDVGCRTTDLIGSSHGIEIRSIFLRRDIIRFIIHCPLRAKLNFETGETKVILKQLFRRYFGNDLVLPKQGFCGFPSESRTLVDNYILTKRRLDFDIEKAKDKAGNIPRDLEWKFINTELFLQHTEYHNNSTLIGINNKYNITKQGINNDSIYKFCEGGDKYSEKQYHLIYEDYFKQYKFKQVNILEIGILEGYSMMVHSDYFIYGKLYGFDIDIKPFNNKYEILRNIGGFSHNNIAEIRQVSSIDPKEVPNNIPYMDIIIDDGDHNPCSQAKTFENYYSKLNISGLYIIEDVTQFRYDCLKIYLDILGIKYKFLKAHKIYGSIFVEHQKIDFSNKEEAYKSMCEYEPLIKHYKWCKNQYNLPSF